MQKDWSHKSNWLSATCKHTVPLWGIHIHLLWKSSSRQVRLMTYTPGQILGRAGKNGDKSTCNLKSRVLLYILQCLLWLVHHWSETTNTDFVYHILLLNVLSKNTGSESMQLFLANFKYIADKRCMLFLLSESFHWTIRDRDRWLSWLSIGLSCGRSWVQLQPDQHSGS